MSLASVVDLKSEVCDPDDLGIDATGLDDLAELAGRYVDEGTLPSCQLSVARYGRLAMSAAFGTAGITTRYPTFSATKPITNSAVWMLVGEGRISPETVVAEVVPAFGTNGKDVITLEQVVCQTAGFPHAPLDFVTARDRAARLDKFAKWRLNFEPGTASEYHPTSAHWVLAEVIESISGTDFRTFVKQRVVDPLGLPTLSLGVPLAEQCDIADLIEVGRGSNESFGSGEVSIEHMLNFNDAGVRALGVPAAGAMATSADMALLYQAFMLDPYHLWRPDILADVTTNVRNTMWDRLLDAPANLTFGLVVNGQVGARRGFGERASAAAFGWGGAGGQMAWADPRTGISFCFLTNGLDADLERGRGRVSDLSTIAAALADVGVAKDRRNSDSRKGDVEDGN
ncbi:MAG: serine hydrolase domain-containing protein [Acidimicrobiales bacterium]